MTFEGQPLTIYLQLSDGTSEELVAASLAVGEDNALYCRVKEGRFEARFSRQANYLVSDFIDSAELNEGFVFQYGGQCVPLRPR